MKRVLVWLVGVFMMVNVAQAQSVKAAVIEPLTGPVAGTGEPWANQLLVAVDVLNAKGGFFGGHKLELQKYDNGGNVERTNEILKRVYDQGIRYVFLGIGSNNALAAAAFVERQNRRNPESPMLFFNTSGGATELTNEKCSYWQFRWAVGVDMSASALVRAMTNDASVKRIYQFDAAYAAGKSFNESAATLIKQRLPAAVIVGSDLIQPFGKVQDFTPFVLKLKQLRADTILTSTFDADFLRFYKAVVSSGLRVKVYTPYGALPGHLSSITPEEARAVPVLSVTDFNPGDSVPPEFKAVYDEYRKTFGGTYFAERNIWMLTLISRAFQAAGSDDPRKVARALEHVTIDTPAGVARIRPLDHQFTFPLTIVQIVADPPNRFFVDGKTTGVGLKTVARLKPDDSMMPTRCSMERP